MAPGFDNEIGAIKEPAWDVAYLFPAQGEWTQEDYIHEQYWETPDTVIEVVSPKNRATDIRDKRRKYARAGIPEYWIVKRRSSLCLNYPANRMPSTVDMAAATSLSRLCSKAFRWR